MRKSSSQRRLRIVLTLFFAAALVLTAAANSTAASNGQATASQALQSAWTQAGDSGQYTYHTTIVQTLHPTLLLENVGRTARTDTIALDGEVNAPAGQVSFQLQAANKPPVQIKIDNGVGYGRLNDTDPWTKVDLATDLFAPSSDPTGFWTAADNVRVVDGQSSEPASPADILPPDYLPVGFSCRRIYPTDQRQPKFGEKLIIGLPHSYTKR